MGRGKIAEKSEMAHFRIDTDQKKTLMAYAKKLGEKKNFSNLVRDAVKRYVEALQQEAEIQELRKEQIYQSIFSGYDKALETKDLSLIDKFVSSIHQQCISSIQEKIAPEIEKPLFDLKLNIAYQHLIFAIRFMAVKMQLITSLSYVPFSESERKNIIKQLRKNSAPVRSRKKSRMLEGEIRIGDTSKKGRENE